MRLCLVILLFFANTLAQYDEQHRPQIHFSPPANWMNDPNGMVFHKGEYHLFYQYYPNDTVWGPMHWGHAVSRDLVRWQHLPVALAPDNLGYIFSGSAVLDKGNTSGFGAKDDPPLVAMFTYHLAEGEKAGRKDFQYQGIAHSRDNGRTWTKHDKNPVIPNTENIKDFRDTKVFWHEAEKKWVVVLAAGDHVRFYESPDLKTWRPTGTFGVGQGSHGGVWECPDLFPMKIGGETKWVLLVSMNPGGPNGGSATQYFIGNFNGKTFKNDNSPETVLWLDHGRDNYAGVTWSNAPNKRHIFLGWMSNWDYAQKVPTEKWRSAMTLPRELTLRQTKKGTRLVQNAVKETESLRSDRFLDVRTHSVEKELSLGDGKGTLIEMDLEIDLSKTTAKEFGVELTNARGESFRVGYDTQSSRFYSDRTNAGEKSFSDLFSKDKHFAVRSSQNRRLRLHLIFDVSSAEMFADGGEVAITDIYFPTEDFARAKIFSDGGKTALLRARAWKLKSIWR